jgi:hypothetical protein
MVLSACLPLKWDCGLRQIKKVQKSYHHITGPRLFNNFAWEKSQFFASRYLVSNKNLQLTTSVEYFDNYFESTTASFSGEEKCVWIFFSYSEFVLHLNATYFRFSFEIKRKTYQLHTDLLVFCLIKNAQLKSQEQRYCEHYLNFRNEKCSNSNRNEELHLKIEQSGACIIISYHQIIILYIIW